MMHIVLLVLKGAGLFLGGLILFLLAFLLAALFVPVRYRVRAVYGEGEKDAKVRISWLLHLLSLEAAYAGEGFKVRLRLLGIGLGGRKKRERKKTGKKGRLRDRRRKKRRGEGAGEAAPGGKESAGTLSGRRGEEQRRRPEDVFREDEGDKAEEPRGELEREGLKALEGSGGKETYCGPEALKGTDAFEGRTAADQGGEKERERAVQERPGQGQGAVWEQEHPRDEGHPDRRKKKAEGPGFFGRIRGFFGRFISLVGKIRFSFLKICDKLRDIRGLAGQAAQWLGEEGNKAALGFLAGQAKKLVLHVLPRKGGGRITFGFEDPYTTGQVLAAAAPFYPVYSSRLELCPVFDRKELSGELDIRGRLRLFTLLQLLFQVYRNKEAWRLVGGLLRR